MGAIYTLGIMLNNSFSCLKLILHFLLLFVVINAREYHSPITKKLLFTCERFLGAVSSSQGHVAYLKPYTSQRGFFLKRCPYPSFCLRTKYHCTSIKNISLSLPRPLSLPRLREMSGGLFPRVNDALLDVSFANLGKTTKNFPPFQSQEY